tara:strand:+ start:97484 stop:97972 length:489 start_codon:yes stop_codon:yes gene_type:complete
MFEAYSSDNKFTTLFYPKMHQQPMKFSNKKFILVLIILMIGCNQKGEITIMDNGLVIEDIVVGEGTEAMEFNKVVVNYTGKLEDGSVFDSSMNPGREPFTFTLGVGSVIKGWDLGVKGMKVGGKRKLKIPAELGYGSNGAGKIIPSNAVLIFDVELLEVEVY